MVDTTIRIALDVDGSSAIKEFSSIKDASKGVLDNIKQIQNSAGEMISGSDEFFSQGKDSIVNSFSRINKINQEIDSSPIFSEKQLSDLYAEREMLRRGIEATINEMRSFVTASSTLMSSVGGKKAGQSLLKTATNLMPNMRALVTQVADFQRSATTLMDTASFKAGIKNKLFDNGIFEQLGMSRTSKAADALSEILMFQGTDQTQRKGFMSQISRGSEKQAHLFDSFANMLPSQFQNFHAAKGAISEPNSNEALTNKEKAIVENLLKTNPYFLSAAEKSGVAVRLNGTIGMRNGLTRGLINNLSSELYDAIISSAKGMPMYGITDVNDKQFWDRIARKNNKPFLGNMNAARILSDNFSWLTPNRGAKVSNIPLNQFSDTEAKIPFSPNIKRYEVANYTLSDLQAGVDLNRDRTKFYGQSDRDDRYMSIDHSLHLENIFRHRKTGKMPNNNDAIDDIVYLQVDPRLADPGLDEKTRNDLMQQYAKYIDEGLTKSPHGKQTHYTFSRAHKGLGLEFVADPLYNAIAPVINQETGERDKSVFWGGLKNLHFVGDEAFNKAAKTLEYASKPATSGESIQDLFGTKLPKNLKIGLFDLEDAAKFGQTPSEIGGSGMNGTSYINSKYVPRGFQARMPGVKTALSPLNLSSFLAPFGGSVKTIGPDGRVEEITDDLDLLLSMSDVKNAGIKYKDDNGKLLPTEEIKKNIAEEIERSGGKIFANKTMKDAQGGIHWMSRQASQILGNSPEFVEMTTRAFLDEYARVGTMQGALDTVFAGNSEMRDLILATNGAVMGDKRIQDEIQGFRLGMLTRISQGDTILPRSLETSRAMAQPYFFNAIISGLKNINESGTGIIKDGETKSYYDTLYSQMSEDQRKTLGLLTMDDDEIAFQKLMASVVGISRYPATTRSAREVKNISVGNSQREKAIQKYLSDSGFDPDAFYISPSSPVMQLLQDADFDGDVMDLIGLAYTGKNKKGEKVAAAEILKKAYDLGIKKIDERGLSQAEADKIKEEFKHNVFGADDIDLNKGIDVMKVLVPAMQNGYFMGGPDATIRNAMQVPWDSTVLKAMSAAESQYSVNSIRNKTGIEMDTTPEQLEVLSKYRAFTEFFHIVDKNRDKYGNVSIPNLIESAKGSDGLLGAKFWSTNLPFNTMSSNVRSMMLSRYFAKQRGVDINKNYDWNYIFDSALGKKDESTALGRMQSALRDTWMGYLNADYLAIDEETIAKLGELRSAAIDEQAALVKNERDRQGKAFNEKGSNRAIAERVVNRLGGKVIQNALSGMAMSASHMHDEGVNDSIFTTLEAMKLPNVVGGLDFTKLLSAKTTPKAFEEMSEPTQNTKLARLLESFNLLTVDEKKRMIDNMPRLSFSSLSKFAYNPANFMEDLITGRENNSTLASTEIGQAAHTAIEHFMQLRMNASAPLSEDQLKAAQKEALDVFDEYLGLKKQGKGFKLPAGSRGLTDAERQTLKTSGTNLNDRYYALRQFLGGEGLLSIYPESDWQVVGIESSDVGKGPKTAAGNMIITGKGKKLTTDEDVGMTGSYDLRFRSRKDDQREVMADIKNYWKPSDDDWKKWRVQQAIYDSQLQKNGVNIGEVGIIEPYQNRIRKMIFSDADLNLSDDNVSRSINRIQQLAKENTSIGDVLDAAKFLRENMFGDIRESVADQIVNRKGSSKSGKFNTGSITDALWLHDRYNEAIEADEEIQSFVNKRTRERDKRTPDDVIWRSKYNQANLLLEQSKQEEIAGNTAQAKDLQARYDAAMSNLDLGLSQAVVLDTENFGEDIFRSIAGNSGTKAGRALVESYDKVQERFNNIRRDKDYLSERIDERNQDIEDASGRINSLKSQERELKEEKDILDRIQGYTDAINSSGLTTKEKGIAKRERTKLLNRHPELASSDEFFTISSAIKEGNDKLAAERLETAREKTTSRLQATQDLRKKQEEEMDLKVSEVEAMTKNLDAATQQEKLNEPFVQQYIKQLQGSATELLGNTFNSLTAMVDKEAAKPMDLAKNRLSFIEQINNAKVDAKDLFERGLISGTELTSRLSQAEHLLSNESLNQFDQNQIDAAKLKLGITQASKDEIYNKGLQERINVLNAQKELNARKAAQQFKEDRLTNPHARLSDYKKQVEDEYNSEVEKVTEQYKKDFESQNDLRQLQQGYAVNQITRRGNMMRMNRFGTSRNIATRAYSIYNNALTQAENRNVEAQSKLRAYEKETAGLKEGDNGYAEAQTNLAKLREEAQRASQDLSQLQSPFGKASATAAVFGQTIERVAARLGRQLFQKALQETKRFIKEFDASMNEIQAITLKSDSDMASVRSNTINKAIGLRTSVSNVANTEAALYRQGLSDQEVSNRTESIIKFATVTKLNVTEATKIITTALQNDLVPSAEQAMDALVALGDSAATTAAEIGKGMQKAAASAKVAGVSYAELTALLTVGTSDTQLSGTQVGTALQTVFTRMRRISLSGWTADQNGEKTTASDAEAALKSVGIDLFSDKNGQKMRTAYEVLSDLAGVWEKLSDVQKSVVTNALAGTRQTNIFSTLMEGMSEDGGKRIKEYLDLASNSGGITQSKYEIAMQSLAASLDTLKSSWDAVVESFVNSGVVTGALDIVSGFLQFAAGSDAFEQAGGVIVGTLTAIGGAILALKLKMPILAGLSAIVGLVAGIGTTGVLKTIFGGGSVETDEERFARESAADLANVNNYYSKSMSSLNNRRDIISEAQKKYDEYLKATESGNTISEKDARAKLISAMNDLGNAFPTIAPEVKNATTNLSEFSSALTKASDAADAEAARIHKETDEMTKQHQEVYGQQEYNKKFDETVIGGFDYGHLDREAIKYLSEAGADTTYYDENGDLQSHEIIDNFSTSQNIFSESNNPTLDKATGFVNLFNKSDVAKKIIGSYYKNDETMLSLLGTDPKKVKDLQASDQRIIAAAYDSFWKNRFKLDFSNEETYDAQRRTFNNDYIKELIGQWNLSDLATDTVSESTIQNIFTDKFFKMITDENGDIKDKYFIGDLLNVSAISAEIDNLKKKGSNYLLEGYTPEEIAQYRTSVDNAVDASLIDLRKKRPINQQREDLIAAVSTATNMSELKKSYEENDRAQEFANVLANSPELLSAYVMATGENPSITWEQFQDIASKAKIGYSQPVDIVKTAMSAMEADNAWASEFKNDDVFEVVYKNMQNIFGDMTDEILKAYENGEVSEEIEKYINQSISKNSLKPDTGLTQYTKKEIADLADKAMSSDYKSLAEYAQANNWTKSQYDAVNSIYGAEIDRYKNMTEAQRTDIEGLNLKRDFDVKIAVAGIDDLESANKVLQGTTQLIENLKKGGQFEIKAKLQMESDNYNFEQQVAMLQNGTSEEQMNALMSLNPGWSKARIEANMTEARANADRAIQDQREQTAGRLTQLAKTMGVDYAQQEAAKMGYKTKTNPILVKDALEEINKYAIYQPYQYDETTGALYWTSKDTGQRYAATPEFQNWFDRMAFGEFEPIGTTQDIDRENLAYGLQRSKTPYEIEQAQRVILSGDTNRIDELRKGNNELYQQAFNGLTQNQKDYLAIQDEYNSIMNHYGGSTDYLPGDQEKINRYNAMQTAAYADFGYKTRDEIYNAASLYNPITNPQFYNDYAAVVGSDIAERTKDQNYTLTAPEESYATLRMQRYAQGYDGITQIDKIQGAYDMIQSIEDGTYQDKYGKASEDMKKDFTSAATGLDELIDAYLSLDKNAVDYAEKEAIIKDRLTDTKAALKTAAVEAKGYGEANSKAAKSMGELAKGGLAQKKEIAQLTKQAKDYQDAITAAQKSTGKTGKQIAKDQVAVKQFGKIGFDKSDIEQWTKEEATEYSKLLEDSIQENFGTEMLQPLVQQALDEINAQPFEVRPKINMITDPQTGDLDFSQLAAVVAQYNESLAAALEIFNGILAEAHVRVIAQSDKEGNGDVKVVADSSTFKTARVKGGGRGGSYNNKGGGGGGGGGKSATDKLLEKQKQRISEIEHQSKMLEIQEKYLDFTNDYDNYGSNIDQQIANQERLRSAYAQSIQELKNQLATLERGSDDWNKANEQLMQYEENLENIKNTINDLGAKRITIVEQKQENEDKRGSHNLNMLSKMAARYQKSGQFESYEGIMEQTIEETRKQIHLNDKQITEWENLLKTFTENSDSWIQTRDKIWAMREENAELQNQMASDLIDLQEARISQIAEDLQNQKAPLEHRANMLDTYGQMYESVNDFTKYRGTLEGTIDTNRQMKEMTDAAIAQVKKQIDGMKESDPARQSAIQTLYELEEASAQYEASILSNQQAIEESLISELTQAHQDSGSILEHELKLLSEAEKEFVRNDDFVNYENILEEKARNASDRLKDQQNALEDYLALQNSGKITEGGQQWRELEDTIRSTKENVASLKNEWQEALQAIEKAKFTNLKETFAETYDLSQHQQKLVQYDQTKYQNNGQLTNYGTALEWEGKILEDQRDSIQNHIKDLEEQLKESKEFPELYKEITKEIMTWEEKLSDTNNRIEKNTELIEKNQDAIRKARIAVENEADKAIRAWIQKQRNMLSATVTMQNNIFAVISKNYQQQWALEQKTLDKKKQTLNEEKNLINERVNFRKKMMDQEAKDEELAEYRRQLALISQDTTRTREANELRRKIQEMEKEQAMQNAQDVANAEIQSLNDQSKAIDDYAATYQENLTELLSNINNFKDIIDGLLSGSFEDFVNWNAEYNEDFKKSSDEQRQQLINGWEDTWYTMLGQLRTYWDQVDESMQSRDGFLELLKTQDEYLKLSDTGRESYLYRAGELYDSFTASMIDDATFSDNHEIIDTINDLKDWTFNVNIAGLGNYDFGGTISDYVYNRDRSVIPYEYDSDYKGVGYVAPPPAPTPAPTSSSGGGGSGGESKPAATAPKAKKYRYTYTFDGSPKHGINFESEQAARQDASARITNDYSVAKSKGKGIMAASVLYAAALGSLKIEAYKKGGLVDYTGLAMVHGTPQKPEAFLSDEDRANMRAMLDAFNYVKAPTMTHIDPSMYGTTTNNYGDVNITINEAKIDNDQDISALAQKIGKEFTKELSKSGFNTASYAW